MSKKEDKEFFIRLIKEDDSKKLSLEKYQTNIRHKEKEIAVFKERAKELGDCLEAIQLLQHCDELQKDIDKYRDLFRGRRVSKNENIVYVSMDIYHALDYLGYLINDNINKHLHTIRNLMHALQYETGTTYEDKKKISHYKELIDYFKNLKI